MELPESTFQWVLKVPQVEKDSREMRRFLGEKSVDWQNSVQRWTEWYVLDSITFQRQS